MAVIFLSALAVGFSGAMMPGPLLTYTVKQALNTGPQVGLIIAAGHALLELVLITLIFLGFDLILQSPIAQTVIGIIGGALLIYMGAEMIVSALKNKVKLQLTQDSAVKRNLFFSGAAISAANPYFLLWWAIIGLGFLLQAYKSFGILGIASFYAGHIGADFLWYGMISGVVGKTRKFIKENLYRIIIIILGCLLIFFGGNFFYKALW
mgnify:CR=1 FL=1